jgi:hypothetical protein
MYFVSMGFYLHFVCLFSTAYKTPPNRPQMKREDPVNLSILLTGGKETNKDSPSNGE